jgi:hypothetical protein
MSAPSGILGEITLVIAGNQRMVAALPATVTAFLT